MKVYVLLIDACYDYEHEQNVFVYETKGAAQEELFGCVQCFLDENAADSSGWVCAYESSDNVCYQENGDYARNHIEWTIYEKEVNPDKELDDEKGSNGLWDKAAEIVLKVASIMGRNGLLKDSDEPLYAEDCGQEQVYNILKEM